MRNQPATARPIGSQCAGQHDRRPPRMRPDRVLLQQRGPYDCLYICWGRMPVNLPVFRLSLLQSRMHSLQTRFLYIVLAFTFLAAGVRLQAQEPFYHADPNAAQRQNLGENVNTVGIELLPLLSPDG